VATIFRLSQLQVASLLAAACTFTPRKLVCVDARKNFDQAKMADGPSQPFCSGQHNVTSLVSAMADIMFLDLINSSALASVV
jgi:hypothetical protein